MFLQEIGLHFRLCSSSRWFRFFHHCCNNVYKCIVHELIDVYRLDEGLNQVCSHSLYIIFSHNSDIIKLTTNRLTDKCLRTSPHGLNLTRSSWSHWTFRIINVIPKHLFFYLKVMVSACMYFHNIFPCYSGQTYWPIRKFTENCQSGLKWSKTL